MLACNNLFDRLKEYFRNMNFYNLLIEINN